MNIGELLHQTDNIINMGYIDNNYYLNNKSNLIKNFILRKKINKSNENFLKEKIEEEYVINDIYLDNNQKEAIYSEEVNTLVLAGAGSGKTLTIMGKIKYLIEEKRINPKEILCISFTNDTVNNLKDKIKYDIDIFTFHKLALEIISDYKKNITIVNNYLDYIIDEIFLSIVNNISEKDLKYFNNTISSFICLLKNNNYSIKDLDKIIKKNKSKILEVIRYIYLIYEEELNSTNYVDLNDIINLAISLINERGLKRYYKYIIIDEYQDISENRFQLVKTIKDSCNTKLFVVGDDYQSIYRFTGSNMNMITKFKKYFGYTRIVKICNTYRNSNELIKVATKFIMKNKNQIKKNLLSTKHNNKPIKIIYYTKNECVKLKRLLLTINDKVMILGRNNFNITNILDEELIMKEDKLLFNNKQYDFKTVHKSKGLEEEEIVLLHLTNNNYGFPNKKKEGINSLLLPKEKYRYEEERRLFYVALTRTKNNIYLFVDKENPSIFVKEIIRNSKKYIEVLDL